MKPWAAFVGRRYAITRRHSHLVSFISKVSVVGLVIGVALLVLVMSIMNGFDRELRERILGIMPQATLYHRDGIEDPQSLAAEVLVHPQVQAVSPFVQLQGLLAYQRRVAPVSLYGVDPGQESLVSVVESYLPAGAFADLAASERGVLLGSGIAEQLGVERGDRLSLIVPRRGSNAQSPAISSLEVVAVLHSGTEIDQSLAIMGLQQASSASEFPGRVSGLRLQVDDLFAAPRIMSEVLSDKPFGYYGSNWTRTHGNLYQAIHMSKRLVGLLLFLIIAIAAFNLVSTLIMVVVDKRGDIAILRTLGASSREIMTVFMVQGGIIGCLGTGLGVALGVSLSLGVTDFVLWLEGVLAFQFLQSDVYPLSYLPSDLHWPDVFQVAGTALFLSFVASLFPAWRASRVQPAEALRYE
ncbi:lipoprotein-releasing ABC transporter permease subunit [Marinimicrobium alkaliphilum]|uniref:lipoprotein-releasing ABC transporter permease subunit n=1 Tax=Marinimicrobium alkaliphilum TaxID=2202654 RepID=UPI000DBA9BDB|nr:lipoprotein-releasing ABC transporter permease subunit [Marinimicrobium alkaliphilum]